MRSSSERSTIKLFTPLSRTRTAISFFTLSSHFVIKKLKPKLHNGFELAALQQRSKAVSSVSLSPAFTVIITWNNIILRFKNYGTVQLKILLMTKDYKKRKRIAEILRWCLHKWTIRTVMRLSGCDWRPNLLEQVMRRDKNHITFQIMRVTVERTQLRERWMLRCREKAYEDKH